MLRQTTLTAYAQNQLQVHQKNVVEPQYDSEYHELHSENALLKRKIEQAECALFQLKKMRLPKPQPFRSKCGSAIDDEISSVGSKIILHDKFEKREKRIRHYMKCFGVFVRDISDSHCKVVFEVEPEDSPAVTYGVVFQMVSHSWKIKMYNLPPDFRLEEFDRFNPMSEEYLRKMQEALKAHHSRATQIKRLKENVPSHVRVCECLNGRRVEIYLQMMSREMKCFWITVHVEYSSFDIRPRDYTISLTVKTVYTEEIERDLVEQFQNITTGPLDVSFIECIEKNDENLYYCPSDEELYMIQNGRDKYRNREFDDDGSVEERSVYVPQSAVSRKKTAAVNDSYELDDDFVTLRKLCSQRSQSKKNTIQNVRKKIERQLNVDEECEDHYDHSRATGKNKRPLRSKNVSQSDQSLYDPTSNNEDDSVYIPTKKSKTKKALDARDPKKSKKTPQKRNQNKNASQTSSNKSRTTKKPTGKKTKK